MSTAALVLLVLVVKGEEGAATSAMSRAVRDSLLVDAEIDFREVAHFPKDDEAAAIAHDAHATAVVEIVWKDAKHRSATLHFHAESAPGWSDRHLAFEATDAEADRGRTIGFAVVSMLPETITRPPPLPGPTAKPTPEPPEPEPDRDRRASAPEPRERWRPEDFVPVRRLGAFDLAGSMRVGDGATGFGGALSGRWDFTSRFSARLAGAIRAGDLRAANASSLVIDVGGGLVVRPLLAARARPFEVALRADFLFQRYELDHVTTDGATTTGARWEPAVDLAVDAMWLFSGDLGLFAAFGGELAFGKTAVFVRGAEVATVAPFRGVADVGIRVFF